MVPRMTLSEFAAFLESLPPRIVEAQTVGLERAAVLIEHDARESIGEYQDLPGLESGIEAWPELAPSTIVEKERLGYAPPDNPLLRTGELRDSISHSVEGNEALIGSTSEIAVFQELGTPGADHPIPPRPFLGLAAFRKGREAVEAIAHAVIEAFVP